MNGAPKLEFEEISLGVVTGLRAEAGGAVLLVWPDVEERCAYLKLVHEGEHVAAHRVTPAPGGDAQTALLEAREAGIALFGVWWQGRTAEPLYTPEKGRREVALQGLGRLLITGPNGVRIDYRIPPRSTVELHHAVSVVSVYTYGAMLPVVFPFRADDVVTVTGAEVYTTPEPYRATVVACEEAL